MQNLRTGGWLTAERARGYSLILLAFYVLGCIAWIALADGLVDRNGKPLGTDFSNVYAAGVLTLEGRPGDAYDPALQHAAEKKVFGPATPFFGWHYPPFFLMAAAALATLPYAWALFAWMALTIPAYLAAVRAICPRPETLLIATAFPAAFINLGHGQNGFLTAALLGGALLWLDLRPAVAGVLIGLLAYKPQFGLLIPLVLLVTGTLDRHRIRMRDHRGARGGRLDPVRHRRLACLRRLRRVQPRHRARGRRHRLGEDPVDLLGRAQSRRLDAACVCGARRVDARPCRLARVALAQPRRL